MKIKKVNLCADCGKPTDRHHNAKVCFTCLKIREHKNQNRYAKVLIDQKKNQL
jgi:predicted amidophosphoribosyltransferase